MWLNITLWHLSLNPQTCVYLAWADFLGNKVRMATADVWEITRAAGRTRCFWLFLRFNILGFSLWCSLISPRSPSKIASKSALLMKVTGSIWKAYRLAIKNSNNSHQELIFVPIFQHQRHDYVTIWADVGDPGRHKISLDESTGFVKLWWSVLTPRSFKRPLLEAPPSQETEQIVT
jgi:hypothetical protein